jgi:hypothetical protein
MVGRRAGDAIVGAGRMEPRARCPLVEHLTNLGTLGEQPVADRLDVGDDQIQPPGRAGRGGGQVRPELDRAPGTSRCELDQAEPLTVDDVGVEPPAETSVERLGTVDIRDGDDHHLEPQVDGLTRGCVTRRFAAALDAAHGDLRWSCEWSADEPTEAPALTIPPPATSRPATESGPARESPFT